MSTFPSSAPWNPYAATFVVNPDSIGITTASGHELTIHRDRPEVTLDGELHALPSPPKTEGDALLLPAKAMGPLLGCAVRWDQGKRTLSLTPALNTFKVETTPDCYRVTMAGSQPLAYHLKKLQGPPRLVVDFSQTELTAPATPYRVENSYFQGARISQYSLAPAKGGSVVRVVLDLTEWRPYRLQPSADGCQLCLEFPLPDRDLPAPAVTLTDFALHRYSSQAAVATLAVSGKPVLRSGATTDPPAVWVDVENADSRVQADHLAVNDRFVKAVTLTPAPADRTATRLTLALSESVPCTVSCDNSEVRLLLGRCELSGLTIVVDAGHGGSDTGAIGRTGLMEKDVTLDVALRLGKLLEAAGAKVLYTRCDDTLPGQQAGETAETVRNEQLYTRCAIANDAHADLFVAIHCNARGKDPEKVRGTETYYRRPECIPFAQVMQQEVVRALGLPDGGALYHPVPSSSFATRKCPPSWSNWPISAIRKTKFSWPTRNSISKPPRASSTVWSATSPNRTC